MLTLPPIVAPLPLALRRRRFGAQPSFRLRPGSIPAGLTFSRGTLATQVNADGSIGWGPHNLCPYSTTIGGTGWSVTGATPTLNYGTAPDGSATSTRLQFPSGFWGARVTQTLTLQSGANYAFGVWVRGTGGSSGTIAIQTQPVLGSDVFTSVAFTGTWTRLSAALLTATGTSGSFGVRNESNSAVDVEVWAPQLNRDALQPYYPTTSSAFYGLRDADYSDSLAPVYGPELVTNGDFSNGVTGWTVQGTGATITAVGGGAQVANGSANEASLNLPTLQPNRTYYFSADVTAQSGSLTTYVVPPTGSSVSNFPRAGTGNVSGTFTTGNTGANFRIAVGTATVGNSFTIDNISVREVGAASGTELVTNGDFSAGTTGWTFSGSWSLSSGTVLAAGAGTVQTSSAILAAGRTYLISFDSAGSTTINVVINGVYNAVTPVVGRNSVRLTASGNSTLQFQGGANTNYIDNISVQEVVYVTGTAPGIKIEPAATNLILNSGDLMQWGSINGISRANVSGPVTLSGQWTRITESAADTGHYIYGTGYAQSVGTTYTAQFKVKAGTRRYLAVRGEAVATSTYPWICLDTITGDIANNGAGFTATSKRLPHGAWLVVMTWTAGTNAPGNIVFVTSNVSTAPLASSGLGPSFLGDGSYLDISEVQVETGSVATSYIPTAGATATRAADSFGTTNPSSVTGFSEARGTWVVDFVLSPYLDNSSYGRLVGANMGANNGLDYMEAVTGSPYGIGSSTGGTYIVRQNLSNTVRRKGALAYDASSRTLVYAGSSPISSTAPSSPVTTLYFGSGGNGLGNHLNGTLYAVDYYPQALTAVQLQALTT